nr:glycosyltransferase [Bacillus sp. FJAT-42376]
MEGSCGNQEHCIERDVKGDVPQLMAQADLYVQPSLIENQPLSLIEAQISGLPALVNNAGGLPEMVQHQLNGIVYSTENELSGYLYSLISDDVYRNYLGANAAREAVNHWSLEKGTMNVLQVYHEAINMSGRDDSLQRIKKGEIREYLQSRMTGEGNVIFGSVYRPLFTAAEPYPPVVVDKGMWDVIIHSLPGDYCLPDPSLFVL